MNEQEEQAYMNGRRSAYLSLLMECLRELDYDDPEAKQNRWIIEREQAIASLRSLCADFGDNDWDNDLNLSDIIDKHLGDYLSGQDDS